MRDDRTPWNARSPLDAGTLMEVAMPNNPSKPKFIALESDLVKRIKRLAVKEGLPFNEMFLSLLVEALAYRLTDPKADDRESNPCR